MWVVDEEKDHKSRSTEEPKAVRAGMAQGMEGATAGANTVVDFSNS
jgi:hypothetical protein